MYKKFFFSILVLLLTGSIFGTRIVELSGPINPESLYINSDRLYVIEKVSIYIYSLKDFELINKFGKVGEGPGEFMFDKDSNRNITLSFKKDRIIVSSKGKVSFFNNKGVFLKEIRANNGKWHKQFGENFIAFSGKNEKNISYDTINLYDSNLKKITELIRKRGWYQQNSKMSGVDLSTPSFLILEEHMIITSGENVSIFNKNGKIINTIDHEYERKKVTSEDEANYRNWMKKSPVVKPYYENLIKNKLVFPKYFPKIKYIGFTDKEIYIIAYKKKAEKNSNVFFFSLNGKFIKKKQIPLVYKDIFYAYPYEIYKGKVYQLIEDDEDESSKLHITDIK